MLREENPTEEPQLSCGKCASLEMDLQALQKRNRTIVENFSLYRSSVDRELSSKDKEIERLNCSVTGQQKEIETQGASPIEFFSVFSPRRTGGRKGEELADQLAIPLASVQTRSRKGDQDDQKHRSLDLLLDQIVLAGFIHPQDRSSGSQRRLLAVRGSLRERHASNRVGRQGNGDEVSEDAGRLEDERGGAQEARCRVNRGKRASAAGAKPAGIVASIHDPDLGGREPRALRRAGQSARGVQGVGPGGKQRAHPAIDHQNRAIGEGKIGRGFGGCGGCGGGSGERARLGGVAGAGKRASEEFGAAFDAIRGRGRVEAAGRRAETRSGETVRMDRGGAPVRQSGVRSGRRERELAAGHVANRRVDAPASHRVDESVHDPGRRGLRSASQLDNTQKTELVLGGLPLELYESFVQVIVPILQSRERANLQVFKRQALVYGRSWASVGRRDEAQRGRSAGAVVCAGKRGEHAYGRGVDGDGDGDVDVDIDGDGGDGSSRECRAETEEE
ncbi:uncharacterized protein [Blastocystis hominis]|uniref:Uncharacterized protein n=1 Tax=Blastocystis hominis TaxID=12968 RepID=D8MBD7_BLAHO|nr:uncharacterized protein [Blastocystis hominis]CBK25376.2 unnamed protein product [Blastocystis hominis]|eukprot:XP_012899424.1 uncharacterized protein [Blastocystis hominis]